MKTENLQRLLIANDDMFILLAAKQIAQDFFEEVVTADNGLVAFQEVQKHPPDYFSVIILDINMPVMGGVESCEKIKSFYTKQHVQQLVESHNSPRQEMKRRNTHLQAPPIFALTADCNPENIAMYKQHFVEVFDILSEANMKRILCLSRKSATPIISKKTLKEKSKLRIPIQPPNESDSSKSDGLDSSESESNSLSNSSADKSSELKTSDDSSEDDS